MVGVGHVGEGTRHGLDHALVALVQELAGLDGHHARAVGRMHAKREPSAALDDGELHLVAVAPGGGRAHQGRHQGLGAILSHAADASQRGDHAVPLVARLGIVGDLRPGATAADGGVGALGHDAVGGGLQDLRDVAVAVALGLAVHGHLHEVTGHGSRHEDGLAALEPAHRLGAVGHPLDPHLLRRCLCHVLAPAE